MRSLPFVLLALLLLAGAPRTAARAGDEEATVRLKRRTWETPLWAPAGATNVVTPDEAFACGPWTLTLSPTKGGAQVAWTGPAKPGKAVLKPAPAAKVLKLGKGADQRQVLLFADALGRWRVANAASRQAEIAGRTLAFFDADFDGTYLEPGVDWYALEGARHALACAPTMVVGTHQVTLSAPQATQDVLAVRLADAGGGLSEPEREAQAVLNDVRLHFGLPGAVAEPARSADCRLHAKWCALNRRMEHSEPEGSAGYTAAGEAAAHASLIWRGRTPTHAFFGLWDTPMHGYPLAAPWYTRTAIGWEGGYLVVWWHEGDEFTQPPFDERTPAVFPPDGASGIPVDWHGEIPDPREGDTSRPWGYPIRIYLRKRFRAYFLAMSDVQARLVPVGTDDEVPLQVNEDALDFFLMPRVPLAPRTTYHLTVTWTERKRGPRRLESTFTTGKQSGQRREGLEK